MRRSRSGSFSLPELAGVSLKDLSKMVGKEIAEREAEELAEVKARVAETTKKIMNPSVSPRITSTIQQDALRQGRDSVR